MLLKKFIKVLSLSTLLTFSFGVNAYCSGTNCGDTADDNIVLGVLLLTGVVIYVVRNNSHKGEFTTSYYDSFYQGNGITLAGKSLDNKDAKFRLSTLSSDIEQKEVFQDSFSAREENAFSINMLKYEF